MAEDATTHKAPKVGKRDLIVETAIRVIAERGFYAATTDQIAHEAGISVGTIYNYFRSKEEILSHIFRTELSRRLFWLDEIDPVAPRERLAQFMRLHFESVAKQPHVTRILVRERSFARGHDPEAVRDFLEELPKRLARLIREAQSQGVLRPIDPEIAATAILGVIESLTREAVERDSYAVLLEKLDDVIAFIWDGLGTP